MKNQLPADVVVEPVDLQIPMESVVVSFSKSPGSSILESSLQTASYNRYSLFAFDPVEVFALNSGCSECPFSALAERIAAYPAIPFHAGNPPFVGGWVGFFTYEAGLMIERIERTTAWDLPLPIARFCLYDTAAVYDHEQNQWYLTAVDWPRPLADIRPTVVQRLDVMRRRLNSADRIYPAEHIQPVSTRPIPNMTYPQYLAGVERAKRYIEAGDIYQVNLTQRFTVHTDEQPLSIYRRLRQVNPSSHAALIHCGNLSILSASPELFLDLRDGHVVTRPIKGTAPRTGDPLQDAVAQQTLKKSEKDRAELTMIVDLLRNDLGRVCQYNSIRVIEADGIEEHPTVYHQVATIEGELQQGRGWLDLLRATYPGGSITGAPKIRAMQIIDELEPSARGVYCGSIGWIGLDGSMSMNIAIRTMVQLADRVHFYAGGAIVADSTPQNEYDEIIAKASGMLHALGCEAPTIETDPVEAAAR